MVGESFKLCGTQIVMTKRREPKVAEATAELVLGDGAGSQRVEVLMAKHSVKIILVCHRNRILVLLELGKCTDYDGRIYELHS